MLASVYLLTHTQSYAGSMGPAMLSSPGKAYVSVFGGAGTFSSFNISQFGAAFFEPELGGPLAVDAFGSTNHVTTGFVGGNAGYQWSSFNLFNTPIGLAPAVELEGYSLGKNTFSGHDINNDTTRLPEHDFFVSYPTTTGVFLINAIANFDVVNQQRLHPYVGAGFGAAVLSITNANSTQVAPAEVGVNHYNSDTNSTDTTFAGQVKAGLSFDLTKHISVFGEYRWLYLSDSSYTFGSTVYPDHAATSSWLVKLGSQNYNLGAAGIRFSI